MTTEINKNWWFHGSPKKITVLEEKNMLFSNHLNTGLGIFLTQNIDVAKPYSQKDGYIAILDVDTSKCYSCSEAEFWCWNVLMTEDDVDQMGYWLITPGEKLRQEILNKGYTTLEYTDQEMGHVLVVLDYQAAKIINCLPVNNF